MREPVEFEALPRGKRKKKQRSCLGCLGRVFLLLFWLLLFVALATGSFFLAFAFFPPFGDEPTARVLLVGLDDKTPDQTAQRSDTIMLFAAKLHGGGATLLSVPRDARVRIPGYRRKQKINAAYAHGKVDLLRETLADPDVLGADLPYHIVFDSITVAAIIDALGGVEVVVPHDMDYDDNWAGLHIHLKAGNRHLTGQEAVGYLRWRKNNRGRGSSDDFSRTERQRQLLVAIKDKARTFDGMMRLPKVYEAFQQHAQTNLTLPQFLMLAWSSRQQLQTDVVPGDPRTIGGVSYVLCDWEYGRKRWQEAQ